METNQVRMNAAGARVAELERENAVLKERAEASERLVYRLTAAARAVVNAQPGEFQRKAVKELAAMVDPRHVHVSMEGEPR